jgi:hypothetical protein
VSASPLVELVARTRLRDGTGTRLPIQLPRTRATYELGVASPPLLDVEESLRARAARRAYASEPLAPGDLAAVLEAAREGADTLPADSVELVTYVVARDVATIPPGIYCARAAQLDRVAELPDGARIDAVVLQDEFARASAILLFAGGLAGATARWGAHGHRLLHLRAGLAAHGAWLAAEERLLAGCAFSGLLPTFLRAVGLADGFVLAPVFAFALGPRAAAD